MFRFQPEPMKLIGAELTALLIAIYIHTSRRKNPSVTLQTPPPRFFFLIQSPPSSFLNNSDLPQLWLPSLPSSNSGHHPTAKLKKSKASRLQSKRLALINQEHRQRKWVAVALKGKIFHILNLRF